MAMVVAAVMVDTPGKDLNMGKCKLVVEQRPDGLWMWICEHGGEPAFFYKTKEDAEAWGEWHIRMSLKD